MTTTDPRASWGSAEWLRLYRKGITFIPARPGMTESYVISCRQVWRPGAFDSEQAAIAGQRLTDHEIELLQDSVNPGGVITLEMVRAARRKRKETKYE